MIPDPAGTLDRHTAVGTLWRAEHGRVRCLACAHRCLLASEGRGLCKVRFAAGGQLRVPFGYTAGVACDPVEKKPFFHVHPGSVALTFGMLGCDFHCDFCQNWITSQTLRDPAASARLEPAQPQQLVATARRHGARLVVSSYNEPLITAEWAVAIFREARAAGLLCAVVSNGHATPEALDFLCPWLDACKIDLKSFNPQQYQALGGRLEAVKETLRSVHTRALWLEVVTLLVPGFNDSPEELRAMARFLASISPDIPWHLTAFHPDYQRTDTRATRPDDLEHAARIAQAEGLRYVYAGNRTGAVGSRENTVCPGCGSLLIERRGFAVRANRLTPRGTCPRCDTRIPGIWPAP